MGSVLSCCAPSKAAVDERAPMQPAAAAGTYATTDADRERRRQAAEARAQQVRCTALG